MPKETNDPAVACTGFQAVIQQAEDPQRHSFAQRDGGLRYLLSIHDRYQPAKVVRVNLLASSDAVSEPPPGFHGISNDLRKGLGGQYIYIIWQNEAVKADAHEVSSQSYVWPSC